jgi:hypothetical protein
MVSETSLGAMEWLALFGWRVEFEFALGVFRGSASRRINGETVRVSGDAEGYDELAWVLVERAASEAERRAEVQGVAAAI